MSRTKILILAGTIAILLGVLLLSWVDISSSPLYVLLVGEVVAMFFSAAGIAMFLTGCFIFCRDASTTEVVLWGVMISTVSLIMIPGLSALLRFEPNVHGWTGLLFFLWLPSCAIGPIFVLVGLSRRFLRKRKSQ